MTGWRPVERAVDGTPDVVLMDVGLPRLNGYEACTAIRATVGGERIVMLAVTGWGAAADLRNATQQGSMPTW